MQDWLIAIVAVFVGGAVTFAVEWWFRRKERNDARTAREEERDEAARLRQEDRRRVVYADAASVLFTYLDQYRDLATGGSAEDPFSNADANEIEIRVAIEGSQEAWAQYQAAISGALTFLDRRVTLLAEQQRDRPQPAEGQRWSSREEWITAHRQAGQQLEDAKGAMYGALESYEGEVRAFRRLVMAELGVVKALGWSD